MIETSNPAWAKEMKALLLNNKAAIGKAYEAGGKGLPPPHKDELLRKYHQVVTEAGKLYGMSQKKKRTANKPKEMESPIKSVDMNYRLGHIVPFTNKKSLKSGSRAKNQPSRFSRRHAFHFA